MCRSVQIERVDNRGIRSVKSVLRYVNRISSVGLRIFSWQDRFYTVCGSVRIERIDKRGIRSVKSVLRSVNRISLVGLRIFSWQEWLYTVCRSVRIERIDKRAIRSVKSVLRSVNRISLEGLIFMNIFMARVGINRFSICKDGTDRRKGYTVCEELSSVRKVREVRVGDHWVPIT